MLGGTQSSGMTRLKSRKDISNIDDSTNNPPVNSTGDDTEQHDNPVPLEQTQSLNGTPIGSDG